MLKKTICKKCMKLYGERWNEILCDEELWERGYITCDFMGDDEEEQVEITENGMTYCIYAFNFRKNGGFPKDCPFKVEI